MVGLMPLFLPAPRRVRQSFFGRLVSHAVKDRPTLLDLPLSDDLDARRAGHVTIQDGDMVGPMLLFGPAPRRVRQSLFGRLISHAVKYRNARLDRADGPHAIKCLLERFRVAFGRALRLLVYAVCLFHDLLPSESFR